MMKNICFFDIDGTLIDSYEGIKYSLTLALQKDGLEAPEDSVLRTFVGPPIERSIARYWDIEADRVKRIASDFQQIYRAKGYEMGQLYPQIPDVLSALQADWELYVVTNKNPLYAQKTLAHFGISDYFKEILCTDRVHGIDKGRLIKDLLLRYSSVDKSVMIGDTMEDYHAAKENNCAFIGALYGLGLRQGDASHFKTATTPIEYLAML